ncbi:hypothetical protein I317_06101 [Kwoniella heveanensis CBS 569]|nr:hypothetical protein I317_06101 [Kwoniella heveanensis CBS 569]
MHVNDTDHNSAASGGGSARLIVSVQASPSGPRPSESQFSQAVNAIGAELRRRYRDGMYLNGNAMVNTVVASMHESRDQLFDATLADYQSGASRYPPPPRGFPSTNKPAVRRQPIHARPSQGTLATPALEASGRRRGDDDSVGSVDSVNSTAFDYHHRERPASTNISTGLPISQGAQRASGAPTGLAASITEGSPSRGPSAVRRAPLHPGLSWPRSPRLIAPPVPSPPSKQCEAPPSSAALSSQMGAERQTRPRSATVLTSFGGKPALAWYPEGYGETGELIGCHRLFQLPSEIPPDATPSDAITVQSVGDSMFLVCTTKNGEAFFADAEEIKPIMQQSTHVGSPSHPPALAYSASVPSAANHRGAGRTARARKAPPVSVSPAPAYSAVPSAATTTPPSQPFSTHDRWTGVPSDAYKRSPTMFDHASGAVLPLPMPPQSPAHPPNASPAYSRTAGTAVAPYSIIPSSGSNIRTRSTHSHIAPSSTATGTIDPPNFRRVSGAYDVTTSQQQTDTTATPDAWTPTASTQADEMTEMSEALNAALSDSSGVTRTYDSLSDHDNDSVAAQ